METQDSTPETEQASEVSTSVETPKANQDRPAEILKRAKRLYQHFKKAGFSRDSFIELGESVKADKSFQELHPVVAKLIMKIAAKQLDDEAK